MLEVVTEGPVPQHLKHRVMIGIMSDFLEVIMLATYTQTLLRVSYSGMLDRSITKDDILELVHPSVSKHQGGVALDHHRCRRDDDVPFASKESLVGLTYLLGGHYRLLMIIHYRLQRYGIFALPRVTDRRSRHRATSRAKRYPYHLPPN